MEPHRPRTGRKHACLPGSPLRSHRLSVMVSIWKREATRAQCADETLGGFDADAGSAVHGHARPRRTHGDGSSASRQPGSGDPILRTAGLPRTAWVLRAPAPPLRAGLLWAPALPRWTAVPRPKIRILWPTGAFASRDHAIDDRGRDAHCRAPAGKGAVGYSRLAKIGLLAAVSALDRRA